MATKTKAQLETELKSAQRKIARLQKKRTSAKPLQADGHKNSKTEAKLRESEERFRQIIAVADAIPYSRDYASNRYTFMGDEITKLAGCPAEEVTPALLDSLIVESIMRGGFTGMSSAEATRLVREGKSRNSWRCEHRIHTHSGEERWLFDSSIQIFGDNKIPTGSVGIFQDITERKKIEAALAQSEKDYRTLFENVPVGLYRSSEDDHMLDANPALIKMFGYPDRASFLAEKTADLYVDPATSRRFQNEIRNNDYLHNFEAEFRCQDGTTFWAEDNTRIVRDQEGKPLFYEGSLSNITERKQAEAERDRRVSELEALYENGLLISELVEPKRIAQKMVDILANKLNWHHAAVRLYRPEDNRMELLALSQPGLSEDEIQENIKRLNEMLGKIDRGLSGWVIRNKFTVRSGNLPADPRYIASYPGMHSGLYVPLQIGNNVLGSIAVETEDKDAFSEQDERLLVTLTTQASIAIRNAQLYLQTQKELQERKWAEEKFRQLNTELEKRVEERTTEIETTRQRLELAAKAAGLGIWEWNITTGTLIWDAQMHRIYGTPPEIFDGRVIDERLETFLRFVHPEDRALQLQISESILRGGKTQYQTEYRIIKPDGQISYLSDQGVAVFSPNGTLERIIGIVDDVTQQRQAEQALHESETYARLLFDAAPDPVSVSDVNGVMIDANRLFERQHQIGIDEMRGKHISELDIFPPQELQKAQEYVMTIMDKNIVPPVELDFYAPDGTLHTLEMNSYPIEVHGKPLVLSTSRDITVHKKAEETLRLANAEMERALRIKDEFLASMSHELRTPLNAILGISESLEEQIIGPLNEKQLKYLRTINESGHHLHELINDILDLSKIEAGRMELNIMDVHVAQLCESSMRMIKELAQKKGLSLSSSIDPQVITIKGDDRRLKQTLVNLLSNAVKFTPTGNEIGLELHGHPETLEVTFIVWDHGIGISTEDTDRLFKPFVQLDSSLSREYAGTGLGLALVAQMVRLHGGNVSVESELGKGSRFIVTLPWAVEEQNPQAQVISEDLGSGIRSDQKRSGRVLIVEDTHTVASLMQEYLENKGYEVYVAHNGLEGVTLAKKKLPDLILMDVMMPVMDGMEATRQIRTDPSLEKIPVIALTALAMPGDRERCFAAGMSDYLSKPIQFKELLKVMDKHTAPAKSEKQ